MPLLSRRCSLFYSIHCEFAPVSGVYVENVACEEVGSTEEPKGNSGVHCLNQVLSLWFKEPINIQVTHETKTGRNTLSNRKTWKNRRKALLGYFNILGNVFIRFLSVRTED